MAGSSRIAKQPELSTSFFGEDILLNRLLKTTSSGTYVDVGANHPIDGSNTYRLYTQGWTGLAIDPNPKFAAPFRRHRPRDRHIVAGVAAAPDSMTYHCFDPDVFNTLSARQAALMVAQGRRKIGETIVPCLPLSDLIVEHLGDRPIDILNVDCEGMDLEVLQSFDLAVNRPMAIVVEDHAGFMALRDRAGQSGMDRFLRSQGYSPISQAAWSAIFVARDWRDLIQRSAAFDPVAIQRGYMPA
jgi:FkbM family methyltransferase